MSLLHVFDSSSGRHPTEDIDPRNLGSCLADHLAGSGNPVLLWSRSKDVMESLNEHHRNPGHLADPQIPSFHPILRPLGPSECLALTSFRPSELCCLRFLHKICGVIVRYSLFRILICLYVVRQILGKIHNAFDSQSVPLLIL